MAGVLKVWDGTTWNNVGMSTTPAMPYIIRLATVDQSVGTGANVLVALDTTEASSGTWSPTAAGALTIPNAGIYTVSSSVSWAGSTSGNLRRTLALQVNGVIGGVRNETTSTTTGGAPANSFAADMRFNGGEVLTLAAFQNSGAALNIANATYNSRFSVRQVA